MTNTKQIFVVGNSRSGTTMMGRILNNHSDIFTFKELHFFGQLWSSDDENKRLSKSDAVKLCSKLLCIQEFGILNQETPEQFNKISDKIILGDNNSSLDIFKLFLNYSVKQNSSIISCDQTPRNVFYIQEILDNFPSVKVVNLVRDPRDILLSQKNKWKRKFLGASGIPYREAIRSYFNYHPITISKIWNSTINSADKFKKDERVFTIKFEDLLINSDVVISDLCDFLNISFEDNMVKVPNVGSSTSKDISKKLGLDKSKISKWKNGGLSSSEIYLSQKMCSENMSEFQYPTKKFSILPLFVIFHFLTFPIKIFISFLLNLHRIKNLKELIRKRILN